MIAVEEAQALVRNGITPLGVETVALSEALGRVLAYTPAARVPHPAQTVSAMDGYAVRAADVPNTPKSLTITGESAAGHPFDGSLGQGQAVRIFTGAQVPPSADTIVLQEDTDRDGDRVSINNIEPGRHIRPKGQDFCICSTTLAIV